MDDERIDRMYRLAMRLDQIVVEMQIRKAKTKNKVGLLRPSYLLCCLYSVNTYLDLFFPCSIVYSIMLPDATILVFVTASHVGSFNS